MKFKILEVERLALNASMVASYGVSRTYSDHSAWHYFWIAMSVFWFVCWFVSLFNKNPQV